MQTTHLAGPPAFLGPVERAERIWSLDVVRGFALLGILLMNIIGFGLFSSAYDNPTAAGGQAGANLWIWIVMHVLAEGKMRCLFSMLFGIVHAFLLWHGDILYPYALCALVLYPFRNVGARHLLILGAVLVVVTAASVVDDGFHTQRTIAQAQAAEALEKQGLKPTEEQQDARKEWEQTRKRRNPDAESVRKDAEA